MFENLLILELSERFWNKFLQNFLIQYNKKHITPYKLNKFLCYYKIYILSTRDYQIPVKHTSII